MPAVPSTTRFPSRSSSCAREHAATIAKDFPEQCAARDFMRETVAMPYKFYSQEACVLGKDYGPYEESTLSGENMSVMGTSMGPSSFEVRAANMLATAPAFMSATRGP